MRTVLSEAQLHVLRSCYDSNPRPDALLKEQLVELTGLSSRVIRVWFQNKRCKDKKRNMLQTPMEHGTTEQVCNNNIGLFGYLLIKYYRLESNRECFIPPKVCGHLSMILSDCTYALMLHLSKNVQSVATSFH